MLRFCRGLPERAEPPAHLMRPAGDLKGRGVDPRNEAVIRSSSSGFFLHQRGHSIRRHRQHRARQAAEGSDLSARRTLEELGVGRPPLLLGRSL